MARTLIKLLRRPGAGGIEISTRSQIDGTGYRQARRPVRTQYIPASCRYNGDMVFRQNVSRHCANPTLFSYGGHESGKLTFTGKAITFHPDESAEITVTAKVDRQDCCIAALPVAGGGSGGARSGCRARQGPATQACNAKKPEPPDVLVKMRNLCGPATKLWQVLRFLSGDAATAMRGVRTLPPSSTISTSPGHLKAQPVSPKPAGAPLGGGKPCWQ